MKWRALGNSDERFHMNEIMTLIFIGIDGDAHKEEVLSLSRPSSPYFFFLLLRPFVH